MVLLGGLHNQDRKVQVSMGLYSLSADGSQSIVSILLLPGMRLKLFLLGFPYFPLHLSHPEAEESWICFEITVQPQAQICVCPCLRDELWEKVILQCLLLDFFHLSQILFFLMWDEFKSGTKTLNLKMEFTCISHWIRN